MAERRRVTSADVAREAGVSRATVSYVLNDVRHQRISPETRKRVRRAASKLGYQPNAAARALRQGAPAIVLVELPYWPIGSVVAGVLSEIVTTFEERGYTALLHFERSGSEQSLLRTCSLMQPMALLAPAEQLTPAFIRTLRASGTGAIVAIGDKPMRLVPTLVLPQEDIGRVAISHLAERGHKRVLAYMPADQSTSRFRDGRIAGARREAKNSKLVVDVLLDGAGDAVADLFARSPRPTALYAYNDELAFRVLELLIDRGIAVPDEVAVIGCDDSPLARAAHPSLTSVKPWSAQPWQVAANAIDALLQGESVRRVLTVDPPVVVEREST